MEPILGPFGLLAAPFFMLVLILVAVVLDWKEKRNPKKGQPQSNK